MARTKILRGTAQLSDYKVVDGTSYDDRTPQVVIDVLENARRDGQQRICIRYGDPQTGLDWGTVVRGEDCGRVGRSMGPIKIPLLIKTRRSMGGEGILDKSIVQITVARNNEKKTKKRLLYRHAKYHNQT